VICVPTIGDRLVQRTLVNFFMDLPQATKLRNQASFGFLKSIPGNPKGVIPARNRAIELRNMSGWAYKSDISSFFDRIQRKSLIEKTIRFFNKPSLRALIEGAVACEIAAKNDAVTRVVEGQGIRVGLGVRQGMPISPFLSNIVLYPFDAAMLASGYQLVRYADDFIVFARSREECLAADTHARKVLHSLGFEIPELDANGKTVIAEPSHPIEFLGLSLDHTAEGQYALQINERQLGEIRNQLGALKDINQLSVQRLRVGDIAAKLENRISGYRAAYQSATNAGELEPMFEKARGKTLESVYSGIFGGEAVRGLSDKQAMLLGIRAYPAKSQIKKRGR
jgi:RNA-directed DNA polymerase